MNYEDVVSRHEAKLVRAEATYDSDELLGNDLVEATEKALNLVLDRRVETIGCR